jgi:hypothetical protein
MPKYTAVLIDTISIQNYVFGSNKLKENLGASYLVKTIYTHALVKYKPLKEPKGYIGGGNALLFFNSDVDAKEFVNKWTNQLLLEFPGVKTAVAISEIEFDDVNDLKFKDGKNKLFEQLLVNKFKYHPQVILTVHGLTAECSRTGLSMEDWIDAGSDSRYFSSISKAKNDAVDAATKIMYGDFHCVETNGFKFTNELNELGSSKGEDSHLAIVHIDGNGIGKRFENCETLEQTRKLSEDVEAATKSSFNDLLLHIIKNYEMIKEEISYDEKIIPIRPIILGGDDITFVCDGRLGIYFAQIFIQAFQSKIVSDNKPLSACAGVAITKVKYPFFRGYTLAAELCRSAKIKRKKLNNDEGSWIDWHFSYGGFSGSLKDIRQQYKVTQGSLIIRPYKLTIDKMDKSEISFYNLIENTSQFFKKDNGESKFPRSKIKELREELSLGKESTVAFTKHLHSRDLKLLKLGSNTLSDNLFINGVTPFYDMIELAELYPKFELEKEEKNAEV